MAQILPPIMPAEMQAAALSEFGVFRYSECIGDGVAAARSWFKHIVLKDLNQSQEPYRLDDRLHVVIIDEEPKAGLNNNTGFHTDRDNDVRGIAKYIMTLCNYDHASTIFFPEVRQATDFGSLETSEQMFTRSNNGHLNAREGINPPQYIQAPNGCVSVFDMEIDWHCAAPLPYRAQKLLFFAVIQ